MWWGSFAFGGKPEIWDPVANTNTGVTQPGYNIFCGGHSVLGNGQVLVTGGDYADSTGVPNASTYDPVGGNWTFLPNMNAGRWYPTNTVLPNGDVVVTSGEITPGQNDPLPQVWQVSSGTWRDLTTAQLLLPLYPEMYVTPNGTLFYAGPTSPSRYLDTTGTGSWTIGPTMNVSQRGYGPSVMYDNGKIMVIGGGAPTATAEIINLNDPVPSWTYTGAMANARRHANATLLPDGTVLVTGGTSGTVFDDYTNPVYPAELWNPGTGTWSTMASLSVYRGYHSIALLLPDGRVLTGGGQCPASNCSPTTTEIYSPPYLFKGTRPTITSAPSTIGGGQTFFVGTPDAANITQVSWIRLGATTHTFNQEQRFSFLSFSQATGGLNVTAPPSANLAPAGFYMLFFLNGSGVPSVASIIQVDNSSFATNGPAVTVSTTTLPFVAKTQIGTTSASRPVQLTNLGTSPVTINSITTGTDFTVTSTTCGSQLAPGSCTINVAFKPTTGGPLNEFLTINDSDSSSPQTVALSGTATALRVPATSVNFGNRAIGVTSPPVPITLTNLGSGPINIRSISYPNSEFSQYLHSSTCGASIPGLSSCQIYSIFTPNAAGLQNGSFIVVDSDPSSPTTISLAGAGLALNLSPASMSFGSVNIPKKSGPGTLTVTNVGPVTINFSSIGLAGASPGDFAIQNNTCGATLAAGTNCTMQVTFIPQAAGLRLANVTFADDTFGSPQVVPLAGRGVAFTTTTLSVDVNPATAGQTINFTATVSPSAATGTVQFLDGSNVLGTGTLSNGTTSFATSSLAAGVHNITAAYMGDTNDASSTSSALAQTVNQGNTSWAIVHETADGNVTSLTIPATASGHLIAVALMFNGTTSVASVSDNAPGGSNTYVSAGAKAISGVWSTEIWYAVNSKPGATVVTPTLAGSASSLMIATWEVSGLSSQAPDATNTASGNIAFNDTPGPPVTTAQVGDFILSIMSADTANLSAMSSGNEFTDDFTLYGNGWAHITGTSASVGTHQASWFTSAPSGSYCASTVAFHQ